MIPFHNLFNHLFNNKMLLLTAKFILKQPKKELHRMKVIYIFNTFTFLYIYLIFKFREHPLYRLYFFTLNFYNFFKLKKNNYKIY